MVFIRKIATKITQKALSQIKNFAHPSMTKTLTEIELFIATGITHFSVLTYHLLLPNSLALEFLFSAIPQYLTTIFLENASLIYLLFGTVLLISFTFRGLSPKASYGLYNLVDSVLDSKDYPVNVIPEPEDSPADAVIVEPRETYTTITIDRTRFMVICCVSATIFSADFPFYNSDKLGKSMEYGLKLMDVGVGSFVYNAGFFSVKANTKRKIRNAALALFLGMLRYLTIVYLKGSADAAEFGVHMNFFFNLGILNVLSLLINTRFNFIIGLLMCATHECVLKFMNLEEMINKTTRSNFLTANIEGISFLLPQMGMFLMASDIGRIAFSGRSSRKIVFYDLLFFFILLLTRLYSSSCRRLHNLCFCMIVMASHTTHGIFYELANRVFRPKPFQLQRFASRHMLFVLLWSSLLVGINKASAVLVDTPAYVGHFACMAYLALVFYVPCAITRLFGKKTP